MSQPIDFLFVYYLVFKFILVISSFTDAIQISLNLKSPHCKSYKVVCCLSDAVSF